MYPSLDPDSGRYRPNDLKVGWVLQIIPKTVVDPENLPTFPPSPGTSASPRFLAPRVRSTDPRRCRVSSAPARSCRGSSRPGGRPRGSSSPSPIPPRQSDPGDGGAEECALRRRLWSATAASGDASLTRSASSDQRTTAFEAMDGLLLSGGADLSPEHYGRADGGQPARPSRTVTRSKLRRGRRRPREASPILGICRGFQAINAFSGGTLAPARRGARGRGVGNRPDRAPTHPLRIAPGTRLARILFPTNVRGGVVTVNSFHHQGVAAGDLAAGTRRQRPGLQPGRRADRGTRGGRRPFHHRRPVPPRADGFRRRRAFERAVPRLR